MRFAARPVLERIGGMAAALILRFQRFAHVANVGIRCGNVKSPTPKNEVIAEWVSAIDGTRGQAIAWQCGFCGVHRSWGRFPVESRGSGTYVRMPLDPDPDMYGRIAFGSDICTGFLYIYCLSPKNPA